MTAYAQPGAVLPRWVRGAFWAVVILEWSVVVAMAAVILVAVIHVGLLVACVPEATVYAANYSEAGWNSIHEGDTQDSVVAKLGEPLDRSKVAATEWWSYSQAAPRADLWWQRHLQFDGSGRLIHKQDACYID